MQDLIPIDKVGIKKYNTLQLYIIINSGDISYENKRNIKGKQGKCFVRGFSSEAVG